MPRRQWVMWCWTLCSAVFLLACTSGCKKKAAPKPPPEVLVISVSATNVPVFEEWIGTLDGYVNAQIRAQVTGYLLTQNYIEGSQVKKGDLLFQIDPRPFQAILNQAQAKLAQDKANLEKTELDVKRYTPLAKEQAISRQELDNAVQANLGAVAQIKADEAAIENAQLNLSFTRITSPVDGLAGTALAQVGDLVGQSGQILTTVSTINPIRVFFQVSEGSYLNFWQRLAGGNDTNDDVSLQLILSNGSLYPQKGRLLFVDRQVSPTTGTLQVAGVFSNADFILRPGQYGLVRGQTGTRTNVILVPQRAVNELQGTYQVALVGETNKVHLQTVQVGQQVGKNWIVERGLKAGDRIVVEGLQKAKEGTLVNAQPYQSQAPGSQPGTNQPGSTGAPGKEGTK